MFSKYDVIPAIFTALQVGSVKKRKITWDTQTSKFDWFLVELSSVDRR